MVSHFAQYKIWKETFKSFAEVNSKYPAIYYGDRVETWKELDERTNSLANALLDLGAKKGDNCAIMLPNCPEYTETIYTGFKIGVVPVSGVNYRYTPEEIKFVLDSTDSKYLVVDEDYVARVNKVLPELKKLEQYIVVGENVPSDMLGYEELIKKYPKTDPKLEWKIKPEDDVIIIMTGGTTGLPKGAVYTNESYMEVLSHSAGSFGGNLSEAPFSFISEDTLRKVIKTTPMSFFADLSPLLVRVIRSDSVRNIMKQPWFTIMFDAFLRALVGRGFIGRVTHDLKLTPLSPIFHHASFALALVGPLFLGSSIVFLTKKEGFDVKELLETIDRRKINAVMGVGEAFAKPIVDYLADHREEFDLDSFFLWASTGAHFRSETKEELLEYIPHLIIGDLVGTTESGTVSGTLVAKGMKMGPTEGFGSGGRILGVVKVINPETGEEVKPGSGEVGEVIHDTGGAYKYYGDAEKTTETWKTYKGKKYFFTGDTGTVDKDGNVLVFGRASGVINTGGEKVYPEEVEGMLKRHPAVYRVGVTSLPDERWVEAVTAVIEVHHEEKTTEEEIIEYCKGKIAGFKVPKHVLFVPKLEVGGVEKAIRPKLKYLAKAMYEEGRIPTEEELDEEWTRRVKVLRRVIST